jgi:spermidine synthase
MELADVEELVTLARADGPNGEVVLRRRGCGDTAVDELIVNGAFAMDSMETSTERALGSLPFPFEGATVLLGGLGLGYTAAELLSQGVARLDVVELEPALVEWARQRLTPVLGRVADDSRVRLRAADLAAVLGRRDGRQSWDAILLDVDNGPDFLIHPHNAALYSTQGLRIAMTRLRPGGLLAVWAAGSSPALLDSLRTLDPSATEHRYEIRRGEREWSYAIYTARQHSAS